MNCFILQIDNELNEYLKVFTHIDNPIYLSIFIILILCITIYFFIKYVIIPREQFHRNEKDILEKKNLQLLALFAELNPDPMLRLDLNGNIIDANNAAKLLEKSGNIIGKNINDIIPSKIDLNNNAASASFHGIHGVLNRSYSLFIKKVPSMEIILLYLRDITESLEYESKLKEITRLSQDQLEEERQRIAYELHDGVGQNLLLVRLMVFKLMKNYKENIQSEEFHNLINILDTAIQELRNISYDLKPRVLDEIGFAPALISLCSNISKESGIKISSDIKGKITRLPRLLETNLYRITQEAISNVIKHANASVCNVRLEYDSNRVKLIISDDGIGFNFEKLNMNGKSLGLFNMRQRIEYLNGTLKIETAPGQGTILFIDISTINNNEN